MRRPTRRRAEDYLILALMAALIVYGLATSGDSWPSALADLAITFVIAVVVLLLIKLLARWWGRS